MLHLDTFREYGIGQNGNGNSATLSQHGDNNTYNFAQSGNNNAATFSQGPYAP